MRVSDDEARGWRAFLVGGDGEANDVVVFCGDCAERDELANR